MKEIIKRLNSSSGQASRMLLILGIIVLVAVIIVFVVIRATEPPPKPKSQKDEVPKVVYDTILGDIKFTFQSAVDKGNALRGAESRQPDWQKDLNTTEKFIIVKIGAQNKGKENIQEKVWDLGNIIDSEGRVFVPLDYVANSWQPDPDLCGALLKPEFASIPCQKIYEVSRISTGLKVEVKAGKKGADGRYSTGERDFEVALLDLIVTQ